MLIAPRRLLRKLRWRLSSTRHAVIVGNTPAAPGTAGNSLAGNIPASSSVIALNDDWQFDRPVDYQIRPDDFSRERLPPPAFAGDLISGRHYLPAVDAAGGMLYCGRGMAIVAGYWAVNVLRPTVLGYVACDMDVSVPPDPLTADTGLATPEAQSARLFAWGLVNTTLILNHSASKDTRLVFPRESLETVFQIKPMSQAALKLFWPELFECWLNLRAEESRAPFATLGQGDRTLAADLPATDALRQFDRRWAEAVPLIDIGWARFLDARAAKQPTLAARYSP